MGKMTVDNYRTLRLSRTKNAGKKHHHWYFQGMFGIIKKCFPHTFGIWMKKGKVIPFCITFMPQKNFLSSLFFTKTDCDQQGSE